MKDLYNSLEYAINRFPQDFELQWFSDEDVARLPFPPQTQPDDDPEDDEDYWREERYDVRDWIECCSDNGWLFLVAIRGERYEQEQFDLERIYTPTGEIFDTGPLLTRCIYENFPELAQELYALEEPILEELARYEPFDKTTWNGGFSYADPESHSFAWEDREQRLGSFVTPRGFRFQVEVTARRSGRPRFTLLQVQDPQGRPPGASRQMRRFFRKESNLPNFYNAYQKSEEE